MTTSPRFASQAPNAQDVVLWRVLRDLPPGRCVEVGGPPLLTAFGEHGWTVDTTPDDPAVVLSVHDGDLSAVPAVDPWVVVVTDPARSGPPSAAGYDHVLFDGVSDLLLRHDHADLADALGHAACVLDDYSTPAARELEADVARWRDRALEGWQEQAVDVVVNLAELEIVKLKRTVSWRVTAPLRTVSERLPSRHRE